MNTPKNIRVKRLPKRGHYDKQTIYSILDEAYLCHVSFMHDGYPVVIPTLFGRDGDRICIHGSSASRMLRDLSKGIDVSIAVTNVHGLVLARSAFHHSMNYASVVIFGKALLIEEREAKVHALKVISEHLLPGRWDDVRGPNEIELKATKVMEIPLDEASAKIRTGDPGDEPEDYELDIWAGVLPLEQKWGEPVADTLLRNKIQLPEYLNQLNGDSQ
jgi:nitroimidazol reductase NimA-like FMN-containing flavoprotein (pyridoxamine 5'-phosphate oxidase superfamily)